MPAIVQHTSSVQKSYGRQVTTPGMPTRPENGLRPAKLPTNPCRPSCPPKYFSRVTEPMVCRMISAAAMVTMAR